MQLFGVVRSLKATNDISQRAIILLPAVWPRVHFACPSSVMIVSRDDRGVGGVKAQCLAGRLLFAVVRATRYVTAGDCTTVLMDIGQWTAAACSRVPGLRLDRARAGGLCADGGVISAAAGRRQQRAAAADNAVQPGPLPDPGICFHLIFAFL